MNEYYTIIAWSDCPYCDKAKELLLTQKKQFVFSLVDESRELLNMYKEQNNWETVPMIFHHTREGDSRNWSVEFIGGFSDLDTRFKDKGE